MQEGPQVITTRASGYPYLVQGTSQFYDNDILVCTKSTPSLGHNFGYVTDMYPGYPGIWECPMLHSKKADLLQRWVSVRPPE
jgi:hypothetical protein